MSAAPPAPVERAACTDCGEHPAWRPDEPRCGWCVQEAELYRLEMEEP